MATILYKPKEDGTFESCMVEASRVQALLENGWGVTNGMREREKVEEEAKRPKEIREAAKEAGIPDYKKARIATLKEKLGYEQSQD